VKVLIFDSLFQVSKWQHLLKSSDLAFCFGGESIIYPRVQDIRNLLDFFNVSAAEFEKECVRQTVLVKQDCSSFIENLFKKRFVLQYKKYFLAADNCFQFYLKWDLGLALQKQAMSKILASKGFSTLFFEDVLDTRTFGTYPLKPFADQSHRKKCKGSELEYLAFNILSITKCFLVLLYELLCFIASSCYRTSPTLNSRSIGFSHISYSASAISSCFPGALIIDISSMAGRIYLYRLSKPPFHLLISLFYFLFCSFCLPNKSISFALKCIYVSTIIRHSVSAYLMDMLILSSQSVDTLAFGQDDVYSLCASLFLSNSATRKICLCSHGLLPEAEINVFLTKFDHVYSPS